MRILEVEAVLSKGKVSHHKVMVCEGSEIRVLSLYDLQLTFNQNGSCVMVGSGTYKVQEPMVVEHQMRQSGVFGLVRIK